jgi:hypothetical protein
VEGADLRLRVSAVTGRPVDDLLVYADAIGLPMRVAEGRCRTRRVVCSGSPSLRSVRAAAAAAPISVNP